MNTLETYIEKVEEINNGVEIVDFFLDNEISIHPFFQDEKRKNIAYVNLILENGRDLDLTGFLARTISMTDSLPVRCALVPQLYDELGSGEVEKLHIVHIANLLNAIQPFVKMDDENKQKLDKAYKVISNAYQKLFFSDNVNTCIGAAITNEIIVQPIFEYIKETVYSYRNQLGEENIIWVTAHDELEEDHVEDTKRLASVISQEKHDLQEVYDAGYDLYRAFWEFFNVLNEIELN